MINLYSFYRSVLKLNIEKSFSYSVMITGISFTLMLYSGYFIILFFLATLNLFFVVKLIGHKGHNPEKNYREKRVYKEEIVYDENYYKTMISKSLTKEEQKIVYAICFIFNKTLKETIEDKNSFIFDKKILQKKYKEKAKIMHPDKGGDTVQFQYLLDSKNILEEYLKNNFKQE